MLLPARQKTADSGRGATVSGPAVPNHADSVGDALPSRERELPWRRVWLGSVRRRADSCCSSSHFEQRPDPDRYAAVTL